MFPKFKTLVLILAVMTMFVSFPVTSNAENYDPLNVYGTWITQSGIAKVEISACENNSPCGKITEIDAPEPLKILDTKNPNRSLRNLPLLGRQLLWGFRKGDDSWKAGNVYVVGTGKTFRSEIRLNIDGTLQVKGCKSFICRSQVWTRDSVGNADLITESR